MEVSSGLLVIVDDAERVEDPTGALARLIESGQPRILVVAVARPDALRGLYGHWTTAVRRSRTGLMMAAVGDLDGDLLSVVLPRRCPIRPRPGLAWIIDAAGTRLAQIAVST
jgi:DNA segregation ATPase FtsK/SpoIIIE, S-DNA-T family